MPSGRDLVGRDLERQRLGAWFFSGFGLISLALGLAGVVGLVSYLAEARRREFGVRIALGATAHDLMVRGVGAALLPVSIGTAADLLSAAQVSRVFESLLTGLSPVDVLTYATVATTMPGSATAAALGAAWRLRGLSPTQVLRV